MKGSAYRLLILIVLFGCSDDSQAPTNGESAVSDTGGGTFESVLQPVRDGGPAVTAIAVRSVIDAAITPDSGPLSLTAPIVYASVPGIADRVEELEATDRDGVIPLLQEDDPASPGGFPYYRHWRAGREVTFPVTISYRSRVREADGRRGPPFGIRPSAGGVSGAGSGFLVLPENVTSTKSVVRWDLSDLAPGSRAITSFGDGDIELNGPPADLMQGWYMAGPLHRYPETGDVNGFSGAWLGELPFDPVAEMQWAGTAYAFLSDFFEYLDPPPRYRVFMRVLDDTAARQGGTALVNSFMLSRGPATADDDENDDAGGPPRRTFLHEMIHLWVGGIEGTQGVISWFSEGLTSYYTNLLPMVAGFETVADYATGVNEIARSYYTNTARNFTSDQIAEIGFGDQQVRRVPYQRGALYFADLDARIRAASNGQESLHTFTREIFRKRREDDDFVFDHERWRALLEEQIGPEAREHFIDVIIGGKTIVPASDAFGPCFERRPAKYTADDGSEFDGYEWVRIESVPDTTCRRI